MAVNYYICPLETLYAIGGGRFSQTNPGEGRSLFAARIAQYGTWDASRGTRLTIVKGRGANGFGKTWCLAQVDDTDPETGQPTGLLNVAAVEADPAIILFPLNPSLLNREFQSLPANQQEAVVNRLEALRLPAALITPTTTVRQIVRGVLVLLRAAQELGVDFPDVDLSLTWNSIPAGQRQRIANWASVRGVNITGITGTTPIRTIVQRLLTADVGELVFGGETF